MDWNVNGPDISVPSQADNFLESGSQHDLLTKGPMLMVGRSLTKRRTRTSYPALTDFPPSKLLAASSSTMHTTLRLFDTLAHPTLLQMVASHISENIYATDVLTCRRVASAPCGKGREAQVQSLPREPGPSAVPL